MCCSSVIYSAVFVIISVKVVLPAKINLLDCGVDHQEEVSVAEVNIEQYPWLGILFYSDEDMGGVRAVTPVVLIQEAFVLANAKDISDMPVTTFKRYARVLLGEGWGAPGRRVRSYVVHPEYGETWSTFALIYLRDHVRNGVIRPMCPPPKTLVDPEFYVVRFKNDYNDLQKEVIPMYYVPPGLCRDFYVASNLYALKMRPPHVVCACSMEHNNVCVWDGGSMLVARDVWGRWQLLGFGVRGPGCSGPSRYLDMASYYPWIHEALHRFQPVSISKINNHKFVLRAGATTQSVITDEGSYVLQRYGVCDESEKSNYGSDIHIERLYRDYIRLTTDNTQYQFLTYNITIFQAMEITCMTLELVNASASSEMKVRHYCPHQPWGPPCYYYRGSIFDISCYIMFADKCTFEINVWGSTKAMSLIRTLDWRWEEGTYYEDFELKRVDYKGQTFMTTFGFEPLDTAMWVPNYDLFTTTEYDPWFSPPTTTKPPKMDGSDLVKQVMPKGAASFATKASTTIERIRKKSTTSKKFVYQQGFFGL